MTRLCVIVPSETYLGLAGARIRYGRMRDALAEAGVTLETRVIDDVRRKGKLNYDAYLLSKCQDARAVMLSSLLARSGRPVGIDLFDDYFSQVRDSRLVWQREWLRSMAEHVSFALCSTDRMSEVVTSYMPGIPCHVLNDPYGSFDPARVGDAVEAAVERTLSTRRVRIGWFGVGDNPNFKVGLEDVSAFGHVADVWRAHGYQPELSILTNVRALTRSGLEMLRRLPVPYEIEEWTEEREGDLISTSLVCLLPVNAQQFSIAKSLNRAVSALTGGTQVLSLGFPLYRSLDPFIYRDPEVLVRDVERRRPAVRKTTLNRLRALLAEWSDPNEEARKLATFLNGVKRRKTAGSPGHIVLDTGQPVCGAFHGRRSSGEVHRFFQRMGQLSIGGLFGPSGLNYDITVSLAETGQTIDLLLTEALLPLVDASVRERVQPLPVPLGKRTHRLPDVVEDEALISQVRAMQRMGVAAAATFYAPVVHGLAETLMTTLPGVRLVVSESDPAYWLDTAALAHAMPPASAAG